MLYVSILTERYLVELGQVSKRKSDVLLPVDLTNFDEVSNSLGLSKEK